MTTLDSNRINSFNKRLEGLLIEYPNLKKLHNKILEFGGEAVVPLPEDQCDTFLSRGELFVPKKIILKEMGKSECHKNAILYCCKEWNKNKFNILPATGYGLSVDGLWRQHSWVIDIKKNNIIETTVIREKYFGVIIIIDEVAKIIGYK